MTWFPGDLSLSIEVKAFKSSLSVKAPSHLRVRFSLSLGRDILSRKLCINFSNMDSFSVKRVWWKFYSASFIYWESFSSFLFTIMVRRQPWVARYLSNFRRNLVDFSPFSYKLHLLLILMPFKFWFTFQIGFVWKLIRSHTSFLALFLKFFDICSLSWQSFLKNSL